MAISLDIKELTIFVAGLIGGAAIGYIFYRLETRGPRPMLQYRVTSAVESQALGRRVELLHDGNPVPRIVELEVFFWNRGRTTLDADSVSNSDPVVLHLEDDAEILAAETLEATRPGSGLRMAAISSTEARIDFDFLEFHDGAMFLLAHTGASPYPSSSGSVKGTRHDVEVLFDPFELYPEHPYRGARRQMVDWLDGFVLLIVALDNIFGEHPVFPMPFSGFGLLFWAAVAAATVWKSYTEFTLRGGRIPRQLRKASKREARARRLRQLKAVYRAVPGQSGKR